LVAAEEVDYQDSRRYFATGHGDKQINPCNLLTVVYGRKVFSRSILPFAVTDGSSPVWHMVDSRALLFIHTCGSIPSVFHLSVIMDVDGCAGRASRWFFTRMEADTQSWTCWAIERISRGAGDREEAVVGDVREYDMVG
jgi:hypothetical protein